MLFQFPDFRKFLISPNEKIRFGSFFYLWYLILLFSYTVNMNEIAGYGNKNCHIRKVPG